jgi:putative transposase
MRRSYVFRLRPTARQHIALAACVESHRELYNAALQERRDAWAQSKTWVYYGDQSAQLTEIRSARPDQAVWSFSSQQFRGAGPSVGTENAGADVPGAGG